MNTKDTVTLKRGDGTYVAHMDAVKEKLATTSKRDMIREIKDLWPELKNERYFTPAELRHENPYVLAIILCQI